MNAACDRGLQPVGYRGRTRRPGGRRRRRSRRANPGAGASALVCPARHPRSHQVDASRADHGERAGIRLRALRGRPARTRRARPIEGNRSGAGAEVVVSAGRTRPAAQYARREDGSSCGRAAPHRFGPDIHARDDDRRRGQCPSPRGRDRVGPRRRRILGAPHAVHGPDREPDRRRGNRRGAERGARAPPTAALGSPRAVCAVRLRPHGAPRVERSARARRSRPRRRARRGALAAGSEAVHDTPRLARRSTRCSRARNAANSSTA